MARRDVERETKGRGTQAALLLALYVAAEEKILGWMRQVIGRERDQRVIHRRRERVWAELRRLDHRTPEIARRLIEDAFSVGEGEAERVLGGRRGRGISAIDTKATSILVDNLVERLGAATTTVGRRVDDVFRREGLRAALQAVEVNQPEGVASDAMVRRLEREGITGFVDSAGRRWKLSTYCRMATRTAAAEAVAEGTAQKMAERGFDLVEISEHGCSHHPGDPAHPCVAREGKTFSLSGLSEEHDRLDSLPPWHPNCTHAIYPSVKAFDPPPLDVVSA